jgi:hypothetical protein
MRLGDPCPARAYSRRDARPREGASRAGLRQTDPGYRTGRPAGAFSTPIASWTMSRLKRTAEMAGSCGLDCKYTEELVKTMSVFAPRSCPHTASLAPFLPESVAPPRPAALRTVVSLEGFRT